MEALNCFGDDVLYYKLLIMNIMHKTKSPRLSPITPLLRAASN